MLSGVSSSTSDDVRRQTSNVRRRRRRRRRRRLHSQTSNKIHIWHAHGHAIPHITVDFKQNIHKLILHETLNDLEHTYRDIVDTLDQYKKQALAKKLTVPAEKKV